MTKKTALPPHVERLVTTALDHAEHPAQAVGALMAATGAILERLFGAAKAAELMRDDLARAVAQSHALASASNDAPH